MTERAMKIRAIAAVRILVARKSSNDRLIICEAGHALILCQAIAILVSRLARAFSKGYFRRIVNMEKQSSGRLQILGTLVAAIFLAVPACEKRPQTTSATQQSQPSLEIRPDAPAKTGEPATVSRDSNSFASYIHFPKDATDDSAVQFYCDVSTEGAVDATYGL